MKRNALIAFLGLSLSIVTACGADTSTSTEPGVTPDATVDGDASGNQWDTRFGNDQGVAKISQQ